MRDVHVALLRVLEATEEAAVQPPDAAGVEAPPDLGPHNAFRCLLRAPSTAPTSMRPGRYDFGCSAAYAPTQKRLPTHTSPMPFRLHPADSLACEQCQIRKESIEPFILLCIYSFAKTLCRGALYLAQRWQSSSCHRVLLYAIAPAHADGDIAGR